MERKITSQAEFNPETLAAQFMTEYQDSLTFKGAVEYLASIKEAIDLEEAEEQIYESLTIYLDARAHLASARLLKQLGGEYDSYYAPLCNAMQPLADEFVQGMIQDRREAIEN